MPLCIKPFHLLLDPFQHDRSNSVSSMRQNPFGQLLCYEKKSMETSAIYVYSHLQSIFICIVIFFNRWQQLLNLLIFIKNVVITSYLLEIMQIKVKYLIRYVRTTKFLMNMRIFSTQKYIFNNPFNKCNMIHV